MYNKKAILTAVLVLMCLAFLSACAKSWTCDWCKKTFTGTAYYDGFDYDTTLCKECAVEYFAGFPIGGYAKE